MRELPKQCGWAVEMHGDCVLFVSNAQKEFGQNPGAKTQVFTRDQVLAIQKQAYEDGQATAGVINSTVRNLMED